jgi:hypothetical protein
VNFVVKEKVEKWKGGNRREKSGEKKETDN